MPAELDRLDTSVGITGLDASLDLVEEHLVLTRQSRPRLVFDGEVDGTIKGLGPLNMS